MSEPAESSTPSFSSDPPTRTPKAADFAATRDWPSYFQCVQGKPARETLLAALASFEREGAAGRRAVDLGCGEGRDTLELLRRGWTVQAIDGHPMALELLAARVPEELRGRLTVQLATFERAAVGGAGGTGGWGECDLFNASFSLPFCPPGEFAGVWARVRESIRSGGRFAGQLFGDRDSWAVIPDRTHHERSALDGLFTGFEFEELREEEKLDTDCAGEPKHWHVFHIVARRM